MLAQKIHCQSIPWTTAPPTNGPSATPRPEIPDQIPSAAARFSAGTASLIRVRVSGVRIAAPRPCNARAAISNSIVGARAANALAAVNRPTPATNIRIGTATRALGLLADGEDQIDGLRDAVAVLARSGADLEHADGLGAPCRRARR